MSNSGYRIPTLPPAIDLETKSILKALSRANRALAELKGTANAIPNQGLLIDTLSLQEAKASSEVENIITTQDELFQSDIFPETQDSAAAKEVSRYRDALKLGFDNLKKNEGIISNNSIIKMYQLLKGRSDGFRSTMGTQLLNDTTGEIVYTPPQNPQEIIEKMRDLERFINDDGICDLDPIIKMALIHHQFESIHPFSDGNGRIGRILNVLYLARAGLLNVPILYISRHIIKTKGDYYRLLQEVRDCNAWEGWILYMLLCVEETSQTTLNLVKGIKDLMQDTKHRMRRELPKIYSQDLLNNLFRHPYTRIEYVMRDLHNSRPTAAKYLESLVSVGILHKYHSGRGNYYVNVPLFKLLSENS